MSLKKNILYSGFLTSSLYIFQFITYPYVARVLGVTAIGACNFVQSLLQYFILFSTLGITALGCREIARCQGDRQRLDATFSQLFTLNLSLTLLALVVYFVLVFALPQLAPYRSLLLIGASQLLFNVFAADWLFRGLEDFRYIALRMLFVRMAYVVAIFVFVRTQADYLTYFAIVSAMSVVIGITNWTYRRRFVRFFLPSWHSLGRHIRPMLFLGSQLVLTSLYTTFNVVYLGMMCGDAEVGYYTTATKIENIILALYTSLTLVMMPRVSAMMEEHDEAGVHHLLSQSFLSLFAFALPAVIFAEWYAPELVWLVAGPGYEGAIFSMRLVMPALLIVGLEQILIVQLLMPSGADKEVFVNSCFGAAVSLVLNVVLVSNLGCVGSAVVWLASEVAVLACAMWFVRGKYNLCAPARDLCRHAVAFLPLAAVLLVVNIWDVPQAVRFSTGVLLTAVYSHIVLRRVLHNAAYDSLCNAVVVRWHRRIAGGKA